MAGHCLQYSNASVDTIQCLHFRVQGPSQTCPGGFLLSFSIMLSQTFCFLALPNYMTFTLFSTSERHCMVFPLFTSSFFLGLRLRTSCSPFKSQSEHHLLYKVTWPLLHFLLVHFDHTDMLTLGVCLPRR